MTASVHAASELEHPIGRAGRFVLRLPAGTIRITGTDAEVARVRDLSGRSLADRFVITAGNGSLELAARQRFGLAIAIGSRSFGEPSPELQIEVPSGASIDVETASADIVANRVTGPKRIRTASGDLGILATSGEVDLEVVSGDTRIEGDGPLEVRGRVISGDFRLRAPKLTRFDMSTTSGDIHLDAELAGAGPYAIKSISGDVTIVARAGLQVEAQTITGDLSSGLGHRSDSLPGRKLLVVGHPVATLAFKSVSGDLEIVEARDAVAADRSVAVVAASEPASEPDPAPTADAAAAPAPAPGSAPAPADEAPDLADAARLGILQALERGEMSVEEASRELAALEVG